MATFDARMVRGDIAQFNRVINNHPLTYLDSGATTLPPRTVLEAMNRYYELHHANVHRGVYQTAAEATAIYEGAREAVAVGAQ